MSDRWYQKYVELTHFVAEHPQVEVGVSRVVIPESVRPEFYQLFDAVRTVFVEENSADLLNEARSLSEEYTRTERELSKLLELEQIYLEVRLHRFLHNPIDAVIRELFDPLFDLLKGRMGATAFEHASLKIIGNYFRYFYKLGYEKWLALSLLELFEADKLLQIIIRRPSDAGSVIIRQEASKMEVPPPRESKRLSFDHAREPLFTVPDFIIHSTKADRYIALRSQWSSAIATASNASKAREWLPVESVVLEPGLILIYVADEPEEIQLVADAKRICRPDLMIKCEENNDCYGKEKIEELKLQHNALKPMLGTYVVSREPLPEPAYKSLVPGESAAPILEEEKLEPGATRQPGIHILTVALDKSRLTPIIDAFIRHTGNDK